MSIFAQTWYKEVIRDKVRHRWQSRGGYLDGTMAKGEAHAGEVRFFTVGRAPEMYKLSGSIQKVRDDEIALGEIRMSIEDYELSTWIRPQDQRKQGAGMQEHVAKGTYMGVHRKTDDLKFAMLDAVTASGIDDGTGGTTSINTVGDGSATIDILDALSAHGQIRGVGAEESVFWPIPNAWWDQLMMYKEFANADYVGPDLPFAKAENISKKTWRGINVFTVPDEHFKYGSGKYGTGSNNLPFDDSGYLDTFMWAMDSCGWEQEVMFDNMDWREMWDYEGTPILGKVQLGAAAVGLLPEGIKRIRMKAINSPTRPA